ncbi:hypothetical protein JTE90_027319 [Oedothorax gibbosus]|uniref:Uncharacterized protein n=1 Tax=Oedothorax gibbosus TaxID=931172 RepID=A0AAV6VYP9_9ARAC|nr:hypothetical protein JTE90_027319 [Oedothorax gibbosus]
MRDIEKENRDGTRTRNEIKHGPRTQSGKCDTIRRAQHLNEEVENRIYISACFFGGTSWKNSLFREEIKNIICFFSRPKLETVAGERVLVCKGEGAQKASRV